MTLAIMSDSNEPFLSNAISIFQAFVLGYQHAPTLFLKMSPGIVRTIDELRARPGISYKMCLAETFFIFYRRRKSVVSNASHFSGFFL
jgi:hypothetical protein